MATIDTTKPMGAARYVRRERYAWPGGYPLALITTDGGLLCADCVRDNFSNIAWAHRSKCGDGWRPFGMTIAEEQSDDTCDHCGTYIYQDEE